MNYFYRNTVVGAVMLAKHIIGELEVKNCNHEHIVIDYDKGCIECAICDELIDEKSIELMLTTTHQQLMDVVEAGDTLLRREHIVDDGGTQIYHELDMAKLGEALNVLRKGE